VTLIDNAPGKGLAILVNTLLLCNLIFILPGISQADVSVERLTELIDKNPENAQLYIQRGDAYFEKGEFFDAVEDYTTAIELDPESDQAYFGRGVVLARQGMIDDGIADLSVFIKRNPDSSLAYTKRGVRYMWKQDYKNAGKDLKRALELDPDNAEAHDDLGVIYAKRQDYIKAIEHFTATIRLDPGYQKGYHNLALSLFLTGQDEQALTMANQAVALNPNHRDALLLKSNILEELGRYEEAALLKEDAEFLPETNWTESVSVQ
jgi:tetratricopeptide (TPR) repeat protein